MGNYKSRNKSGQAAESEQDIVLDLEVGGLGGNRDACSNVECCADERGEIRGS